MSQIVGKNIRINIFGQSHAPAIGVTIEGIPSGEFLDIPQLESFLKRRAPGRSSLTSSRKETDKPKFICGLINDRTCDAPLTAIIENVDARPSDYAKLMDVPRPGHADYTAEMKYHGTQDRSGGGQFSGRMTAPLCIAGGICMQLIHAKGIDIGSHIYSLGGIKDIPFDPIGVSSEQFESLRQKPIPTVSADAAVQMEQLLSRVSRDRDSVGGIAECMVTGLPAGVGDTMFDSLESRIASVLFGIPAVKGVEFGAGFSVADMLGSENNDPFVIRDGEIVTETNNAGGIFGGISSGMPIIFRAAFKPTPSIAKEQRSVSFSKKEPVSLSISGRHDPCILLRALPVVESAAAIVLLDALLG